MGMAASQARLLCLTARMHDIEYQAQAIQNAKIALSTQSDEVYAAYNAALEDETLTLQTENGKVAATFNTLCGIGASASANGKRYVLISSDNRVIVPDCVGEKYDDFMGTDISPKDGYSFAMYVLGGFSNSEQLKSAEEEAYQKVSANLQSTSELVEKRNAVLDILKKHAGSDSGYNTAEDIDTLTDKANLLDYDSWDPKDKEEYEAAYNAYRAVLYNSISSASEVYAALTDNDKEKFNNVKPEFDYYVSIFNQIQRKGDWISIREYKDPISNQSVDNDGEWLESMIKCGYISVATADTDDKGNTVLNTTSPSSDSALGFTTTSTIDKTALAKAEAKYEHDMKQIDKKDKQYDLSLSKLETERNALKTEYDSVKKVIEDNVDRTFGIFS